VHREEITRVGNLARPELPILFEVFHVQPDRDERRIGARIAEVRRASHARAAALVGGITQLEFSLPRSHAQTAS
jgi:hypothetical protein